MLRRAAHFLLKPELAFSPPNDAIVSAFLELKYQVDLYAPEDSTYSNLSTDNYGPNVSFYPVEYNRRWIMKNIFSAHWRRYSVFSGTSEDPMAIVDILSWVWRRPSFTLADEIKCGSYRGNRSESWKRLCRWAMQRSRFTIVNDVARIPLQKEYARLSSTHLIIVYPGCFRVIPPPGDRLSLRSKRGIPQDSLVLVYSGGFSHFGGVDWMLSALRVYTYLHIWIQPSNLDPLSKILLVKTCNAERLHIEDRRVSWRDSWASMAAADIGMAVYHHRGPQFQNMGLSSNRVCMFLSMGVPVIASRQPSFEFLEKYKCGVLVETQKEFLDAIQFIQERLPQMKKNALHCAAEYINAQERYKKLLDTLSKI